MPDKDQGKPKSPTDQAPGRTRPQPPRRYRVVVFDDEDAPSELVACILGAVFRLHGSKAVELTHEMARRGVAVCGVYPHGIAESKAIEVMDAARAAGGYALRADVEPL